MDEKTLSYLNLSGDEALRAACLEASIRCRDDEDSHECVVEQANAFFQWVKAGATGKTSED